MSTVSLKKGVVQNPPPEEWQKMKLNIHYIYNIQGLKLEDVISKMKSEFGFNASAKGYNNFFKECAPFFDKNSKKGSNKARPKGPRTRPRRLTNQSSSCSGRQRQRKLQPKCPKVTQAKSLVVCIGPNAVRGLLHESDASFQFNKALFHFRQYVFGSAESDPKWASVSKFDYPGASKTYNTFYCAILHIQANDHVFGGRFLRKAFQTLHDEIIDAGLDIIQDVCLNILGTLIRHDVPEIGTEMLKYCISLFKKNPTREHQIQFFSALLNIMGQNKSQSSYYLYRLSDLYSLELRRHRGSYSRSALQAQRWHHLIVRDSETTVTVREVDTIITAYQRLLWSACSELGFDHDITMRIENELLSIQHYLGAYRGNYVARLESFMSKVARCCEHLAFEQWGKVHQSAFLRHQERLFDYYRKTGDHIKAKASAQYALEAEGYKTERWIQFSLQFEHWLFERNLVEECKHYREKRRDSILYRMLEEESAREEEYFLRHQTNSAVLHSEAPALPS